jgi:putative ABC transport system ATP-binding protein
MLGALSLYERPVVAAGVLAVVTVEFPAELLDEAGGRRSPIAIARALAGEPAIVWADEPTGNLDSDTSQEVLDLLLRLNRENGQTFVVVTHDPGVGSRMDYVVRMRDGRIVE